MAKTLLDAVRENALANREQLLAQLHHDQTAEQPAPLPPTESEINAEFEAQEFVVLSNSWFKVSINRRGIECSCAEFRQDHFCAHALRTWQQLRPTRARTIPAGGTA
jgi:hypothetical protein